MALPLLVIPRVLSAIGRLASSGRSLNRRFDAAGDSLEALRRRAIAGGVQVVITSNLAEVERSLERLRADLVDRAMATAINRTLERGRTEAVRQVRDEFNIKARDVRQVLRIRRATAKTGGVRLEGVLYGSSSTRSVNVIRFGASQLKRDPGTRVSIKKVGRKKVIRGAFVANKGKTVFMRTGNKRLPIEPVQTIGPVQMFGARSVITKTAADLERRLPVEFQRAAALYLSRWRQA